MWPIKKKVLVQNYDKSYERYDYEWIDGEPYLDSRFLWRLLPQGVIEGRKDSSIWFPGNDKKLAKYYKKREEELEDI